jgi:uncharacterized protein (TIGR03437 family)
MIRRIAFASCFLAAPYLAHAQTAGACTAATLSGTYSLSLTGRTVTSAVALTADYQAVGTITFDGVSKATATLVSNTNKAPGVAQTLAGTYTIPSNCVGTLNITGGDTATYTLIPYSSGNDYLITGSDAAYILTGSGGPQPASCLASTLSGVFAFSGNGFSLVSAGITAANDISGLLQFDGAGLVTGSWAVATNGTSTPATVSGTYTILATSCTGSATVKDANGVAYTLSYVMTTAEGSDFALVGASATEMFTSTAHATFGNPGLAVANAAGISGGTPAGSLFSIYGSGLSTTIGQEVTTIWPTTLANASVTVNGESAPLYYVSPTQINAQMPLDIAPGYATVIVKTGSTASNTVVSNSVAAIVPATANPGVLIYGSNRAVAQNLPSYTLNSTSAPAPSGSYIVVYFTGGGPVQGGSALVTGHAAPSNVTYPLTETYSATIGGINAPIVFIGLAPGFVGLYQADIQVPTIATGSHNLIMTVGGTPSNTTVISTN